MGEALEGANQMFNVIFGKLESKLDVVVEEVEEARSAHHQCRVS